MAEYRAEVVAPEMAMVCRSDWWSDDRALWTRRRLRKRVKCAVSGVWMEPGSLAYGPSGNQAYRAERIAAHIIEGRAPGGGE